MAASSSPIDWIALVSAALTAVGLVVQHLWVRREISNGKDLARRSTMVERPIERAMAALSELERANKDLRLRRASASCDEIKSRAATASREISRAVNLCSQYAKPGNVDFDRLDTDTLVELAENLSDACVALVTGQIEGEARRLGDSLEELLAKLVLP